jgi:Uma2 family endonuclease
MSATIAINQLVILPGQSVLMSGISWQQYDEILTELGENHTLRLAYDRELLEIMVPLPEHEFLKEVIGDLIKDLADELELEYESFGSTTWRRQQRMAGAEPDNCFYIQNVGAIRGRVNIDLNSDPPPDLVLEIDIASKSLDKLPIYAQLGIQEVWRYDKGQLRIYHLTGERYVEAPNSIAFSGFPVKDIPSFVQQNLAAGRRTLRQLFRAWVQRLTRS